VAAIDPAEIWTVSDSEEWRAIVKTLSVAEHMHMGILQEIGFSVLTAGVFASFIAAFIKGSRPPQPLEIQPPMNSHAVANAVVAILSPGISILIFYLGVRAHFTNNRLFDALITLPLINGAYCGRRAFRSKGTRVPVRLMGLLAVIICTPSAIVFLFITIFGVG
jgi:hypothetical protein